MTAAPDWLAGLLEQVEKVAEAKALATVQTYLLKARQASTDGPRMLSYAAAGKAYNVGRLVLERMVAEGRLPCVERRCRGGRIGVFMAREDLERVLAGRKP